MSQSIVQGPPPTGIAVVGNAGQLRYYGADYVGLEGSYATVQDLIDISLPENSRHDFKTSSMERWLRIASRIADSYVGQRFETPLKMWSDAWVWAVCEIAFAGLVQKRGYDPQAQSEHTFSTRHREVLHWIKAARDREITPDQRLANTENNEVGLMVSDAPRGFSGVGRNRRSF